ncbi:hypothetical protein SCH4B_1587 [Ruegeria sp. TrichCH4B]|nr:hypothetical protein SCH4B_1587 [Ruegeria sp. TrichCH4B]
MTLFFCACPGSGGSTAAGHILPLGRAAPRAQRARGAGSPRAKPEAKHLNHNLYS